MQQLQDYSRLKISINGEALSLATIEDLKIEAQINQHGKLTLAAILQENDKSIPYLYQVSANSEIKVHIEDEENTTLFIGIITALDVKTVHQVGYISLTALTYSYLLDITRKSRSFQNASLTYGQLAKRVLQHYDHAYTMFPDSTIENEVTGKPYVQYQETDWDFLKRLASDRNIGLVPAATQRNIKFYFGFNALRNFGHIDELVINHHVSKDLETYKLMAENQKQDLTEEDYIIYHVQCIQLFEIGNQVIFQKKKFYVRSFEILVNNAIITYHYELCQRKGLSQKKIQARHLTGLSLGGSVIGVSKHDVMVKLDIDQEQSKNEAYWFPFTSVYSSSNNTGWYFMPEINDRVRLYFPDHQEEKAVVVNATAISPSQKNTNVRYIHTKYGKEIRLAPDGIYITGKKGALFIKLNEEDGIEISADKAILIESQEEIKIVSEKTIDITAGEINIGTGLDEGGTIEINENINISGKLVKVNEQN
ncbi:contractile injection system protein, VgrG/Pvc8 family [Alkaliphilus crotonatoxidans]